jgi:hypothetical protein
MTAQPTVIVFAVFPGVTQLDFTGRTRCFRAYPARRSS